ncbi:MAG: glycosyltransferase family 1 protein [Candidatus Doudnabacteria bacterium]|nr:glycosyltransferase family 1 protein [Candidatus Doudnabacteria bacterium]
MNIGIDARMLGTGHGGIGRYVLELVTNLLAIDKQNQYFIFLNDKERGLLADRADNRVRLISCNIRHYSLGEQFGFNRLLNKFPLDLMHFPNFNFPVQYKKPFVVTIHDMVHHKISGHKRSHFLHFLAYKKVISLAARNSRAILTVSETSKSDIVSYLQVPAEKISVIYEGSSLKTEVPENRAVDVKRRYLLDKPYFLFVGVLERKKNVVNLTRAFDKFLQKYHVKMDLVIVGKSDPHYPEIKHSALDIKHPEHLVFTGRVDDGELEALYKGAYSFVSASLHEGFGLPGVEALAFGLPLLVSNTQVFNEIYDNAAIYFNPLDPEDIAEKMNLLVRDSQFYQQLQGKSFQRSLLFDWKITAQKTLEVYGNVLTSKQVNK